MRRLLLSSIVIFFGSVYSWKAHSAQNPSNSPNSSKSTALTQKAGSPAPTDHAASSERAGLATAPSERTTSSELVASSERLGQLFVSEILLQPAWGWHRSFLGDGPHFFNEHMGLGPSLIAFSWKKGLLSAQLALGSSSLRPYPRARREGEGSPTLGPYLSMAPHLSFEALEAYGQLQLAYGTLQAGLLRLPFGLQVTKERESVLAFPPSLFFERGLLHVRDYGLGVSVENAGFHTDFFLHEGSALSRTEGAEEIWLRARMGWRTPSHWSFGVSGAVAQDLTNKTNLQRVGLVYGNLRMLGLELSGEGVMGDNHVGAEEEFTSAHADMVFPTTGRLAGLARWDYLDESAQEQRISAGLRWSDVHQSSTLTFLLHYHRTETSYTKHAMGGSIIWKLTPLFQLD